MSIEAQENITLTMDKFIKTMLCPPVMDISAIRREVVKMIKLKVLSSVQLKQQLKHVLYEMKRLSNKRPQQNRNLLTSTLINLSDRLLEAEVENEPQLNRLFELWVNCLHMNFKHFVMKEAQQVHLKAICEFICDIIYVNTKIKVNQQDFDYTQPAYLKYVSNHDMSHELTRGADQNRVQTLLYYVVQLLFILVEISSFELQNQWVTTTRLKVQAFVIINKDIHLVKLFMDRARRVVTELERKREKN